MTEKSLAEQFRQRMAERPLSPEEQMMRIRRVERAIAKEYPKGEMRCPVHLSIGQEAIAVGVCEELGKEDRVFAGHRSHAHYLAKGGDLNAMIAELFGKATGCCGGRGGSMHLQDHSVNFMASMPIVGSALPVATGYAYADLRRQSAAITTVFFGDAAIEEGAFYESLNFSLLHHLPILFVCEDNGYSIFTTKEHRQPDRDVTGLLLGMGFALRSVRVENGSDINAVLHAANDLTAWIRAGNGPAFLYAKAYRWAEHCGPLRRPDVRAADPDFAAGSRDPLLKFNFDPRQVKPVDAEIKEAFRLARAAPEPTPAEARDYVD